MLFLFLGVLFCLFVSSFLGFLGFFCFFVSLFLFSPFSFFLLFFRSFFVKMELGSLFTSLMDPIDLRMNKMKLQFKSKS